MKYSFFLYLQSLPRDLPPTIISQGEDFKPVQGQSEWSSDESPEEKFTTEEPRLKRRLNLKAGVSHWTRLIYLLDIRVRTRACIYHISRNYTLKIQLRSETGFTYLYFINYCAIIKLMISFYKVLVFQCLRVTFEHNPQVIK